MKLLYIGDISRQDALLLYKYASKATNVLEFGSGASTQVLAQTPATITSIETEQTWIDKTKQNLKDLNLKEVNFIHWDNRQSVYNVAYEVIFNDGYDVLRKQFFNEVFGGLKIGGKLLVHDTRCPNIWLYEVIHEHINEIEDISPNQDDSNITVITKGEVKPYKNWHIEESRDMWEFTNSEKPADWKDILLRKAPETGI